MEEMQADDRSKSFAAILDENLWQDTEVGPIDFQAEIQVAWKSTNVRMLFRWYVF